MKFTPSLVSLGLSLLPLIAADSVSFDPVYDNANQSLATVSCSNGANGLLTRGFTTFGSLPNFAHIGGATAVEGFNSVNCGTCWQLTFTNSSGIAKSVNILAIDHASGFNIALSAMNELTNNQAVQFGRVNAVAVKLNASACGL